MDFHAKVQSTSFPPYYEEINEVERAGCCIPFYHFVNYTVNGVVAFHSHNVIGLVEMEETRRSPKVKMFLSFFCYLRGFDPPLAVLVEDMGYYYCWCCLAIDLSAFVAYRGASSWFGNLPSRWKGNHHHKVNLLDELSHRS